MKRPEDMTLEELRKELSGRLISPAAEELDFDELVAIKEDLDAEDFQNEVVWEGLTTKDKLLENIREAAEAYKKPFGDIKEFASIKRFELDWLSLSEIIYNTLKNLEHTVEKMDIPEITENFCGYTYTITCSGVTLRKTCFRWSGTECSRDEETDILKLPLEGRFASEYGYHMEGEYELYDS